MRIENWNGYDIRFNDEGKIITEDFMTILETLSNGMYLPISALDEHSYREAFGIYFLKDGRQLKATLWVEDEMLDSKNPTVLVDIKKAYGYELPEIPRYTKTHNIEREEYIYVIGMETTNFYKIGCSNNPLERLRQLQIANPLPLNIVTIFKSTDMYSYESKIHAFLTECRRKGEWFEINNIFETIMVLKNKYGLDISVSQEIYKNI